MVWFGSTASRAVLHAVLGDGVAGKSRLAVVGGCGKRVTLAESASEPQASLDDFFHKVLLLI
jgi:hypothetical protein